MILFTQKKKSSTEEKECIFQYFLNATLNFAFSFSRIVRLCGTQNKTMLSKVTSIHDLGPPKK